MASSKASRVAGVLVAISLLSAETARAGEPAASLRSDARVVWFVPVDRDGEYEVSVDDQAACRVPCDLALTPGPHRVRVRGDAVFEKEVVVTSTTTTIGVQRRRGPGVSIIVTGVAVAALGVYMLAKVPEMPCDDPSVPNCRSDTAGTRDFAGKMVGGGAVIALTGVVITSLLWHRLIVDSAGQPGATPAPSLGVSWTAGGPSMQVAWTF